MHALHIFLAVGGTTMANIQKTSIAVAEGTGPEIHHSSQEEGQEQQDLVIIPLVYSQSVSGSVTCIHGFVSR